MRKLPLLVSGFLIGIIAVGCAPPLEKNVEFSELRLHRWTALEGGETLVIRHTGSEWTAFLIGDGQRFSCLYQKAVKPRSDWQDLWSAMLGMGLDTFPDSYQADYLVEDGDGFDVEFTYKGRLKRLSVPHPEFQKPTVGRQLLEISDLLGREFQTPVFIAKYDRGEVGEYLIANCKGFSK